MPTSGSWNYQVTALQVITDAAEDIGVMANGQPLDSGDLATMLRALNLLAKQWQGKSDKFPGLKIWTRQRVVLFLTAAQVVYNIGPSGDRASANSLATTLSAAKAANATAISVTDGSGVTNGDVIGFVTDAGTIGWGSVTAGGGTNSLTIAANSIGAAASGKVVYTYTSLAQRFVECESVVLRDNSQAGQPIDMPIQVYTDVLQYEQLGQKFAPGDPTAILIEPQRLSTTIRTNFAPPNLWKTLRFTVQYPAEDYDDATGADDIAFPQEYFAALSAELGLRCCKKFGKKWTQELDKAYTVAVVEGINLNPQNTHFHFEPGREQGSSSLPMTPPSLP